MPFAVTNVPVMPLRAEPSHKSEMISQAVFGECLEKEIVNADGWVKVRLQYDGYEGWVSDSHLDTITKEQFDRPFTLVSTGWQSVVTVKGLPVHLPYGCLLQQDDSVQPGEGIVPFQPLEDWEPVARTFLNTPYLWGGKTVFGADCSGFTQTVYKLLGIRLLRDAYQQATQGTDVSLIQEARSGDLAFFDNSEGRITHVGILLNDHQIIHASGKVRIDPIDHQGIVNADTGVRTHRLRLIRRLFL